LRTAGTRQKKNKHNQPLRDFSFLHHHKIFLILASFALYVNFPDRFSLAMQVIKSDNKKQANETIHELVLIYH